MGNKTDATVLAMVLAITVVAWTTVSAHAAEKIYTIGYSNTADHALFDVMRKDHFQKYVADYMRE